MNARLQLGSLGAVVGFLLGTAMYGCSSGPDDPPAPPSVVSDPSADPESGDQPETLSKAYQHFDVNQLLVTGPSRSIASGVSNIAKERYGFGSAAGAPASEDVVVMSTGDQAMRDVQQAKQRADASKLSFVVRGVAMVHGESGGDAIIELQRDYETSIQAISGQTQSVPLFLSQISGSSDPPSSKNAILQYDAHVRAPGKVVLVAPGYPLSVQSDCVHYDADGYRRLGEYFAKAYARTVFENKPWEPVRPKLVSHAANVVTVKYYVPKLPLAIDTTRVSDPGNYGFGFSDDGGAQITLVELSGPDTVTITLSKAVGANAHLTYALNQPAGGCVGPGTTFAGGARGNLRDSDDAPSQYGYDLQNWGVQFDLAVP